MQRCCAKQYEPLNVVGSYDANRRAKRRSLGEKKARERDELEVGMGGWMPQSTLVNPKRVRSLFLCRPFIWLSWQSIL